MIPPNMRPGKRANHYTPVAEPLASDATREGREAMRAIAPDLPNPERYARQMPLEFVSMLLAAWKLGSEWLIDAESDAAQLRPFGLCGYGTRALTVFGMQVRRVLVEGKQ